MKHSLKRKSNKLKTIDGLVEELQTPETTIKATFEEINIEKHDDVEQAEPNNVDKKRSEIIWLSEDGELSQSVKFLKKASTKVFNKSYSEYEAKRMQKANEFLTDLIIKFANIILGGLGAIEKPEVLDDELQKDKLLKKDVESIVATVTTYIYPAKKMGETSYLSNYLSNLQPPAIMLISNFV